MSDAIYEELLREVAVDIKTPPGWIPHATAIRVHDTLLALRAEVERLRAVEGAARDHLDNTRWRAPCYGCSVFWRGDKHSPDCTAIKLGAALNSTKKEPGT